MGRPPPGALEDATPLKDFDTTATAGVYLPRHTGVPAECGTVNVLDYHGGRRHPDDGFGPDRSAVRRCCTVGDLGNINGYNRVLAEPTNTTGAGGGFRTSYSRCGVTNASGTSLNCQLGRRPVCRSPPADWVAGGTRRPARAGAK